MDQLLETILKSDSQAKAKVAEAEEYRRAQLASLQARKEEIEKEEIKKAVDAAVRYSETRRKRGDNQMNALKRMQKDAEESMEALYKQNSAKWVREIVRHVTED